MFKKDENSPHKKRVLLVVRWPVGGIRTFLRYVYTRFDPQLWHFTIVAPKDPELVALAEDLRDCDVDFVLTSERPGAVQFGWTIFKQLWRGKYHAVHSHGFTSAICAAVPAKFMLKKHIVTSHDVLNKEQFSGTVGTLKRFVLGLVLRTSAIIHSVSHDAQDNLLSFFPFLNREKCVVILNGIEIERFLQATPKNLRVDGITESHFLIGFFGRFMSQKGFRYLVDAIEILSQDDTLTKTPLVLAYGWGGFIEREKREIKAKDLEEHFRFMPFESNVAGVIKGMDVVVMPSLWEACGLLAMETLVCGTPLVVTDCIGLREVVVGTPALQVPTHDGIALANVIKQCMANAIENNFTVFSQEAAERYPVNKQYNLIRDKLYSC